MNERSVVASAAVVGVVSVTAELVPAYLVGRLVAGDAFGWLPRLERATMTTSVYTSLLGVVGSLVTVGLGVGLGYYVGQRIDVPDELPRLAKTVAAGSALGVAGGFLLVTLVGAGGFTGASPPGLGTVALFVVLVNTIGTAVSMSLVVTGGALVGAALTHVGGRDDRRFLPSD